MDEPKIMTMFVSTIIFSIQLIYIDEKDEKKIQTEP